MKTRSVPAPGALPRLLPLAVRQHRFANGLLLACVERPGVPIVDIEVVIGAGAALDDPSHAGRAAMVAEMLDEGTTDRSVLQIADEIDFLGAHLSIAAGWDSTVIGLHVMSERLAPALDVLADVVLRPSFPAEEFARKRRERLTALQQEKDEARLVANKALMLGIFGTTHPYGSPAGGTLASIEALQLDEVRTFYQTSYTPDNAFIVVAGDARADQLIDEFERRFGNWSAKGRIQPTPPTLPAQNGRRVLLVDKPGAAQAEIRVGHPAPARNTEEFFPLAVLNTMLGGSFTSRLNLRLREEMAVTYGASSKFNLRRHGGVFWAGSAVDSDAAAESVAVILGEMQRLRSEPLDANEVRRAAQYVAYGLPRHFETTEDIVWHVREQLLYDLPDDYWWTYVDNILAVTAEQVANVAARHLQPEHAIAVIVADGNAVTAEIETRNLGPLVVMEARV